MWPVIGYSDSPSIMFVSLSDTAIIPISWYPPCLLSSDSVMITNFSPSSTICNNMQKWGKFWEMFNRKNYIQANTNKNVYNPPLRNQVNKTKRKFTSVKKYTISISSTFLKNCFLKIYFIWKAELEKEGETEREVFHGLVSSPGGCNSRRWASLNSGSKSFFQVSHIGAGAQALGPSSMQSQAHWQRAGSEVEQLEPDTHMGCRHCRWQLNPLCHSTGPN